MSGLGEKLDKFTRQNAFVAVTVPLIELSAHYEHYEVRPCRRRVKQNNASAYGIESVEPR